MNLDNRSSDNTATKRLLIFAEDPGAAIYLSHLPEMLESEGIDFRVIATGHAVELWSRKSMDFDHLPSNASGASVLDAYMPSMVVVGTSENLDSFSFELTQHAQIRKIPTVGIVDSVANAAERFRGHGDYPLTFAPDWLIVPDEETANEFKLLKFPVNQLRVCGHPQYDEVFALRNKWDDLDRIAMREKWLPAAHGRIVLMFISEISTGLNPQQYRRSPAYTLQGDPESDGRTEIVLDELVEAIRELPTRPYLVLRLHPKQGLDDLPRHQLLFDQVSQSEPALEMVYAADVIVGMTSMLLLESALLAKPTLSLLPRAEEHAWLGRMAAAIPSAWTRDDLKHMLPLMIEAKDDYCKSVDQSCSREKIISFFREILA